MKKFFLHFCISFITVVLLVLSTSYFFSNFFSPWYYSTYTHQYIPAPFIVEHTEAVVFSSKNSRPSYWGKIHGTYEYKGQKYTSSFTVDHSTCTSTACIEQFLHTTYPIGTPLTVLAHPHIPTTIIFSYEHVAVEQWLKIIFGFPMYLICAVPLVLLLYYSGKTLFGYEAPSTSPVPHSIKEEKESESSER